MKTRNLLWLLLALSLCACAPPQMHDMSYGRIPWQEGVQLAGNMLRQELANQLAVELLAQRAGLGKGPGIVFVPFIYVEDGQQPLANTHIQELLAQAMRPQFELLTLNSASLHAASLSLVGALSPIKEGARASAAAMLLKVVVVDMKTAEVKAAVNIGLVGLPLEPYELYRDSPIFLKDAATEQDRLAASTALGSPVDSAFLRNLPAKAKLQEGLENYQNKSYQNALDCFQDAADLGQQGQLTALDGKFLALNKLGREEQASQAFQALLDEAVSQRRRIDFRLLFKVNSPYFVEDKILVARYAWWLKYLALYIKDGGSCLEIVGHCSHSGDEAYNNRLSRQRAKVVQEVMAVTYPDIKQKTTVVGMGWRENIVGTGSDDATDAIDRRVEFKLVDCDQKR